MNYIDTLFWMFSIMLVTVLAVGFMFYPLWIILHHILSKRLDNILFREPYFQQSELKNYLHWPLSYIKSINYIYLIATPSLAKRKRFKGLNEPLPIGKATVFACRFELFLMLFGASTALVMLLFIAGTSFMLD